MLTILTNAMLKVICTPASKEQYHEFLNRRHEYTQYLVLKDEEKIIAVAVTDKLDNALSAIYTFYDTEYEAYSLGTYAILAQINYAKHLNLPYLYLGYWIEECSKMSYKQRFKPLEMFINNKWQTIDKKVDSDENS